MSMERIATLIASGVGSAAGFYVITQSGLAGTLIGASVAAIVYVGTAQWLAPGVEKGGHLIRAKTLGKRSAGDPPLAVGAKTGEYQEAEGRIGTAGHPWSGAGKVGDASGGASEHGGLRGRFVAWVPAALGVAALLISIYAVQGQEPLERIILREKVVEKPVVTERVVVERETVTVTVPVYVDGGMPASGKPASGTPASDTPAESATTSSSTTTTVSAKRKATTPGTATTSSSSTTSTGDEKPSSTTTTPTTVPPTSSSTSSTTSR